MTLPFILRHPYFPALQAGIFPFLSGHDIQSNLKGGNYIQSYSLKPLKSYKFSN